MSEKINKGSSVYITSEVLEELQKLDIKAFGLLKLNTNNDKIAFLINHYKESSK